MTRKDRYKQKLEQLYEKRSNLMRTGRYIESDQLNRDIDRIKQMIDEADAYEESCKPKPVIDIVGEEELHKSGIIPLMIELEE